jgi:hypothetical protein
LINVNCFIFIFVFIDYLFDLFKNNGAIAKKVIIGKKCIGIAKPGNISGKEISKGNLNAKTPTILPKLIAA